MLAELRERNNRGLNELLFWDSLQSLEQLIQTFAAQSSIDESAQVAYWHIMDEFGTIRNDSFIESAESLESIRDIFIEMAESLEEHPKSEFLHGHVDWLERKAVAVRRVANMRF